MDKRKTLEEFIRDANETHKDKYLYNNTAYINNHTKVIITCPIHGDFEQTPKSHLKGANCPICADRKLTTAIFIEKANLVHKNKYVYTNVVYKNAQTKVTIICSIHGSFTQKASSHLEGMGCIHCRNSLYRSSTEEFIKKANKVHKDLYDYSKTIYGNNASSKVTITCAIHGDFKQTCSDHLGGSGCPNCMTSGFNKNKPAILYYLRITTDDDKVLYKIGITNRTVNERFGLTELSKIEIIKQKLYENGQDAYNWEQKMLKKYKRYKYKGPKVLDSGNTELFTEDVLAMYYAETS